MSQNYSGKNFKIRLSGLLIRVETFTLNITDNSAVGQDNGIPNGEVDGDVAADGEIVVDTTNFNLILEAAKSAGSFKQLDPFDIVAFAGDNSYSQKVEAFGCKLKVSALLNIDSKGGSKHTHTIPYYVTSPNFIKINGIPYLDPEESAEVLA